MNSAAPSLVALRRSAGLRSVRGLSAAELRASNPALASRWASFIEANRAAIVRGVSAALPHSS